MLYEILLALSVAVAMALAIYAFRQRGAPGAQSLGLFMVLVAVYAFAQLLELMDSPAITVLSAKMRLSAIAALTVVWIFFALTYTRSGGDRRRLVRNIVFMSIVPALTVVLVWTNEWHGLVFVNDQFDRIPVDDQRTALVMGQNSIWFWVHAAYSYALAVGGTILILWNATRRSRLHMQRALALTSVVLLAAITILLWILRITPLDYSPIAFVLAGATYLWIAAQHPMLPMIPLGRRAVVDSMADAVVVLDWRQCIADLNPSAIALFKAKHSLIGRPVSELAGDWPQLQRALTHLDVQHVREIERTQQTGTTYYELSVTPLYFQLGQFAGYFLILRDITERKQAKIALEMANVELEKRVAARTAELQQANARLADMAVTEERLRIAREIHDGLGHHLMGLSIQLQAAAGLVPGEAGDLGAIIERCRREVGAAIAESRRSVSALRGRPEADRPLTDAIADLTREFRSRLPCELHINQRGFAVYLSSQQAHTIYRTVQEALTNIQKHARGVQEVSITFDYNEERRLVRIENSGAPPIPSDGESDASPRAVPPSAENGAANGHYGLAGLRERAAQLGGWLEAGPRADGGFCVELRLPGEEAQS